MSDLEGKEKQEQNNNDVIKELIEDTKNENKLNNIKRISHEDIIKFIDKVNNKKKIELEDFNLYNKIKKNNQISPLMEYILENAIDKYNNNNIDNGIEGTGFGYYPGISSSEKDNNNVYFNSNDAFVLYVKFSEKLIGNFWTNHQLLSELLDINPNKAVLSTGLRLANTITDKKSNKSKNKKEKSKENNSNKDISSNNELNEEEKIQKSNNKEYYKLSLGANFEYNALHFLLYGIKKFITFPRIIYYPLVEYKDYEEIDTVILIEEMKEDLGKYFSNFKSINLNNHKEERKDFNLKKNDLVFIETTFDIENKNKIDEFMLKIIKFIHLFINIGLIKDLESYTIKPLVLYNNDYILKDKLIKDINIIIENTRKKISTLNNEKFYEICDNLQIIYCWPTMPIVNNYLGFNDLNQKIDELKKRDESKKNEIDELKKRDESNKNEIYELKKRDESNKNEIDELKKTIQNLKNEIINKKPFNYNSKRFNNNYYQKYSNNYKYINNYNKKSYNNLKYYNNYKYYNNKYYYNSKYNSNVYNNNSDNNNYYY